MASVALSYGQEDQEEPRSSANDDDESKLRKYKGWFRKDWEHWASWRTGAIEDYGFVSGEGQWSEQDKAILKDQLRPAITFNRIDPVVRSVSGEQINNQQEIRYIPREPGDVQANEVLTSAADWFDEQCGAADEDSEAFWDAAICGLGWTESRLDVESDPDEPNPAVERIDPLEMCADCGAKKRNLSDARRVWRVKQMTREEARELYPDASDKDLDASWARTMIGSGKGPSDQAEDDKYEDDGDDDKRLSDEGMVTVVQLQYCVRERFHKVVDPFSGEIIELPKDEFSKAKSRAAKIGIPLTSTEATRKVYKQAFLGRKVLSFGNSPCPDHFSFNCITGFRDRNNGHFYGLVRAMKDPQRWANKWLSQALHIMNSTAKGGVMAERDVTDNTRQFEQSWAKSDTVTWLEPGALAQERIQPKPAPTFPMGFYQLMEFAISSVRDVSGVSVEMLGLREANQPASLEMQRRQSGMTILAPLFKSLKSYYKGRGTVLLYYIQNYLSDGRLIKIVGKDQAQYVPLVKQADKKYDIIVDEGPTSPNQKERVWSLVGENFWALPPPIQLVMLEYSPFPESVVQKIKEAAKQMQEGPEAQMQQQMMMLEAQKTAADTALKQKQAEKTEAETLKVAVETEKVDADIGETEVDTAQKVNDLAFSTATGMPSAAMGGFGKAQGEPGQEKPSAGNSGGGMPAPMMGGMPMMESRPETPARNSLEMGNIGGGMFSPPPGAEPSGGGYGMQSHMNDMHQMIATLIEAQGEQTRELVGAIVSALQQPKVVIRDDQGQVVGVAPEGAVMQ